MKLSKNLILITSASFFFFYAYHSYLILPIRIIDLGGGEHDVGLIMAVAGASTLFFTPISGILGDSYNKKYLLFFGALGLSITNFLFIYFNDLYFSYVILRFFQGCSFSFFFVSAGTFVAENIGIKNQAQALGFFGVFTIINHALAPTISTYIIEDMGYKNFFIVSSVSAFVSFIVLTFIKSKKPKLVQNKKESLRILFETLKDIKIVQIMLVMFLVGGAFVTCLNFAALFASNNLVKPITIFFISYTIMALIMRIFFGWIPDKFGQLKVCFPALMGFGISIGILSFSTSYEMFIISGALFGLSHALVYPSLYSLALSFTSELNKTKTFSLCSLSFTFGGMIFSPLYGYVAEIVSFKAMFLSCSIIVTIGFYFLINKLKSNVKDVI